MATEVLLETRGLSKAFGGLLAVNRVDFGLRQGELRAIIGPNGAGKTTFFNLISGLLHPTAGRILFREEDITGFPAHRVARRGIARTLQITSIFAGMTVRRTSGARPSEGSSMRSIVGCLMSARAMASICCSPPLSVPPSCFLRPARIGK